jgi:glycosyltransferase involved in cell wall biosynthesis
MLRAMTAALAPIVVDELLAARRSLRIALVTETYPPEVNGVALTLQRIVDGLRERHHDIQLIRPRQSGGETASSGDRFREVLTRGVPIPRYPELKMGIASKQALVRLWTLHRPDLVHIATEGPLGWSALQAARRLKLPVCSDFRTNFHAYSRHYGIGWLYRPIVAYLRKFHNHTAYTMVPTEQLRRELARDGFQRLSVVTRGVDTRLFDPARRSDALRRSWGAGASPVVALFVGRLAPEKNLATLVAAFQAMRRARPDARLVVVGDGPARRELAEAVPDAVFAGTRRGEDLAAHFASADVFVFPSMTETFGNVTTEAMASGLAVVAYDHAAAGQLVRSGENGLLARLGDEADFLRHAVAAATDREAATALGREARATACELGWERIVTQVESVFVATLHSAGGAVAPMTLAQPGARAA